MAITKGGDIEGQLNPTIAAAIGNAMDPSADGELTKVTDSSQARMSDYDVAMFTGPTAVQRMVKFIREYANTATWNEVGDRKLVSKWVISDQGLPAAYIHTIYATLGVWYLFFNNHNPYDATVGAEFPLNKVPDPGEPGQI